MTRKLGMVFVLAMAAPAWAQQSEFPMLDVDFSDPPALAAEGGGLEWGLRVGFLRVRDADEGTLTGGLQARFPLGDMFAIEGSIEVHSSEFEDGDIEIIQWPVQATLIWFILPKAKITPYALGGLGWYYTTSDFSGSLSSVSGDTESMFGAHLGLGARLQLGDKMSLNGDLRYIFLEPNDDALEDEEFDTVQFTVSLGMNF